MTTNPNTMTAAELADRFEELAVRAEAGSTGPMFSVDVLEALTAAKLGHGVRSAHIGSGRNLAALDDADALRVTRDALRRLA